MAPEGVGDGAKVGETVESAAVEAEAIAVAELQGVLEDGKETSGGKAADIERSSPKSWCHAVMGARFHIGGNSSKSS